MLADILPFFSLIIPLRHSPSYPLAQLIIPSSHLLEFVLICHLSLMLSEMEQWLSKCYCGALHKPFALTRTLLSFHTSIFSLSYHVQHMSHALYFQSSFNGYLLMYHLLLSNKKCSWTFHVFENSSPKHSVFHSLPRRPLALERYFWEVLQSCLSSSLNASSKLSLSHHITDL